MDPQWSRRRFLTRTGLACAGVAGASAIGLAAWDRGRDEPIRMTRAVQVRDFGVGLETPADELVVCRGGPEEAARGAVDALGGMGRFVRPGEVVVVKPNAGWDRTPIQAANTNPLVLGTVVAMCLEAGAAEVVVTDNTCNEARRCFTRSGIWSAAESAGARVVLPAPHRFRVCDLGGAVLGRMPVLAEIASADRFVNVPVAKQHGLSGFTGAMKNLYGVLGGRRNRLHQRIDASIADLADFVRPTLTVMDATRVLVRNGPQGGDIEDTRQVGEVIASVDQVAVDAYACGLVGLDPGDLPYLGMGQERGLGTADLGRIAVREVS